MMEEQVARGGSNRLKLVVLAVAVIGLLAISRFLDLQTYLQQALAWVAGLGPWGPVAFAGIYVVAAVLFLPGLILTLGAGFLFGVVKGFVVVIIAATFGASAAFLIGRYLARGWVSSLIEGNEKFAAIDEAVGEEGWKIVLLSRLSPVFPFNLLNYAYGLTRVSLGAFFAASFIGMMPGTLMYVYFGSLAGDLASLGAGSGGEKSTLEWVALVVGLVVTLVVTIYVTRVAKKALNRRVGS